MKITFEKENKTHYVLTNGFYRGKILFDVDNELVFIPTNDFDEIAFTKNMLKQIFERMKEIQENGELK